MRLVPLDKKVLRLSPGARAFLAAYTTNLPESPRNVFADAKGRIVAAADVALFPQGEEALVAVGSAFVKRLAAHLSAFLAITGTSLEETEYLAYFNLDADYEADDDEFVLPQPAGQVVFTRARLPRDASEDEFTLFRLKHQLPLQGIDYDEEMVLNVHDDGFVSYDKGCYLGQEIIARVHYRSRPPKELVVRDEASSSADERSRMTSSALDPTTGRRLGFVFADK